MAQKLYNETSVEDIADSIRECEGTLLPKEYQQVEYIESDGTQYIDTTEYILQDDDFLLKAEILEDKQYLIAGDWSTIYSGVIFGYSHYTGDGYCIATNAEFKYPTPNVLIDNLPHTYSIEGTTYKIDNNVIASITSKTNSSNSVYLFKAHNYGATGTSKIYKYVHKRNGIIIRDMIPCYRKSDGVIGLYDLVNNVFYTNQGTGTFLKGNDVEPTFKIREMDEAIYNGYDKVVSYVPKDTNTTGYITDAVDLKIDGAKVDGNYKQDTTTGKNLQPIFQNETISGSKTVTSGNMTLRQWFSGYAGVITINNGIFEVTALNTGNVFYIEFNGLKPNTNYTISIDYKINFNGQHSAAIIGKWVSGNGLQSGRLSNIITTDANGQWIPQGDATTGFCYLYTSQYTLVEFSNLQLEEGSTATPYEPYTGGQPSPSPDYPQDIEVVEGYETETQGIPAGNIGLKITDENNNSVITPIDLKGNTICKLPNGTKDELSIDNKGNVLLTKNVGKVVLDGSESDWFDGGGNAPFKINITNAKNNNVEINFKTNYYQSVSWDDTWTNYNYMVSLGIAKNLSFRNIDISTLELFKTWLSTHNTEVYHQLATPQTINLGKIKVPKTFKGINHIEVLSNLGTTFSVDYFKDYQALINQILELGGN